MPRSLRSTVVLGAVALACSEQSAWGAEGASSHYLPGTAGDLGYAITPAPGLQLANIVWLQDGHANAAVLQGRVEVGLDATVVLDLAAGFYTFEETFLGATYTVGIVVPFGWAELEAGIDRPQGGRVNRSADDFNLSDIAITPLQLNWSSGEFYFKVSETVIAPTGGYTKSQYVNLGRNYWSFDTNLAVTWFNPEKGIEVSVQPGIMFNTENDSTDYETGTEVHLDFTANYFVVPTFAIGPRGYYYQQVTGDSGSGAQLGNFKSESTGLGAGFVWTPASGGGKLAINGKWLHDVHHEKRFDSDYGLITVALKL